MRQGTVTARVAVVALLLLTLLGGCSLAEGAASGSTATSPSSPGLASTTSTTSTAGSPTPDADSLKRDAVRALFARRGAALAAHDKRAWLDGVSDLTAPFATAQAQLFDRMALLPIGEYGATTVEIGAPLDAGQLRRYGADAWVAWVDLGYLLTGYDRAPRTFQMAYVVARTRAGWRLTDVATPGAAQPWDLAPLTVVRSASTLVVGNVPKATLETYLALCDAARTRIASLWGATVPGVVVAPATTDELVAQLARSSSVGLDQVAAITDGPLVPGTRATGDRVFVNPTAFAGLTPDGRKVVLTHELTHVTVRATTTRPVPTWLSEGFADHVGYGTIALAPSVVAAGLLARVRAGQGPTGLPTDGAFDPSGGGTIAPVYNAAYLAITRMVERFGEARVVALYRAVAGGLAVDDATAANPDAVATAAFPAVLGTSEAAFTADWLTWLRRLAR